MKKEFYPDYLFEILLATLITIELLLIISLLFPPDIGRPIDFNAMYKPLPEWYFYWIYELIKYFPGKWIFLGTVLIPTAMFIITMLAPFLDRTPDTSLKKRPKSTFLAIFFTLLITILTILSFINS
ncbi:MAG: hypothetical protein D6828_05670 [Nitrospirae bacterium]|nr:MAG: hypothetical protein D6828_05670 [Nitrospirota bacterium]